MYFMTDKQIMVEIGLRLRKARIEANLTQKELAEKSLVAVLTIKNMEKGKALSFSKLLPILRALRRLDIMEKFLALPVNPFGPTRDVQRVRHSRDEMVPADL